MGAGAAAGAGVTVCSLSLGADSAGGGGSGAAAGGVRSCAPHAPSVTASARLLSSLIQRVLPTMHAFVMRPWPERLDVSDLDSAQSPSEVNGSRARAPTS